MSWGSYLPDLEAYLADLLRNRERIASMVTADDWARREAVGPITLS